MNYPCGPKVEAERCSERRESMRQRKDQRDPRSERDLTPSYWL